MDGKSRLKIVDTLKGISALLVITTHYSWTESERMKYLFPLWVEMAVPVFMIISGYVNALSYERNETFAEKCYSLENIWNKCMRFVIPFLIAFIIDASLYYRLNSLGGGKIGLGFFFSLCKAVMVLEATIFR